jgi:phage terminase large subunit-like protein
MPRKVEVPSVADLGSMFASAISLSASRPSIHRYVPHDKQVQFHSSLARRKLYIGGNRSGKTVGGVTEDVYRLRGSHPLRRVPQGPIKGRIVTTSFNEGIGMVIIPELARWLPPSDLINGSWEDSYNQSKRVLTLENGSTCELMSYDQKLEKFAGTSRHFIHFDEEPPKDIYAECKLRLLDTAGDLYITMTPVEGMTWVYDDLYIPGIEGTDPDVEVIQIDTSENPYISEVEIEQALSGLDQNERKARKEGKFVQLGGLVYNQFDLNRNTIPPLSLENLGKIRGWTLYASMDHGLNNPTCWLWHAVSPSGSVVTFDEVYDNEKLVADYARIYRARNALPGRKTPAINVGDPSIAQRGAQTGDSIQLAYIKEGVAIVLGNNNVEVSVEKINSYLKSGRWVITENCTMLIKQLQRVRWKSYATAKQRNDNNPRKEIQKKDDHAPDSARYFFGFMPDLYIPPETPPAKNSDAVQAMLSAVSVPMGPMFYDPNFGPKVAGDHIVDEYVGEW